MNELHAIAQWVTDNPPIHRGSNIRILGTETRDRTSTFDEAIPADGGVVVDTEHATLWDHTIILPPFDDAGNMLLEFGGRRLVDLHLPAEPEEASFLVATTADLLPKLAFNFVNAAMLHSPDDGIAQMLAAISAAFRARSARPTSDIDAGQYL